MRFRPQFMRSIYGRTIFKMAMFILAIFLLLGTTYFALANTANRNQQMELLQRSAAEVSRIVSTGMSRDRRTIDDFYVTRFVDFAASSSNAFVWVVNTEGELIYSTGLPQETYILLTNDGLSAPVLAAEHLNQEQQNYAVSSSRSSLHERLPKDQGWLIASSPLTSITGAYPGEILMIQSTAPMTWGAFFQSNAVPLSFLIAFFLALIIIIWLSNQITKPISSLTETAEQVYLGDLSARAGVDVSGKAPVLDDEDVVYEDDMSLLIRTFNTLIEKFELREKDRRDFSNSLSHDLRTPITSIKGFVSGMLDGTIPPEQFDHYLSVVNNEADRVSQLINTLLTVVLSEDKSRLRIDNIDINALIRDCIGGLETQIKAKSLDVKTVLYADADGRCLVNVDEASIMRVMTNLLDNAIRYTPAQGVIIIKSVRHPGQALLTLSVSDSGPGIDPADASLVFEQFYKSDSSRQTEGSGLGLYIVKNLLAAHGQPIEVSRSSLGGAKMIFTLPLV